MIRAGLLISLLVLTSCDRAETRKSSPDVVALIERDFNRYCESSESISDAVQKLEADGWQKQIGQRPNATPGQQTYLWMPGSSESSGSDIVRIEPAEGEIHCSVERLSGSRKLTADLANHLAARPGAVPKGSEMVDYLHECRSFSFPGRELRACQLDLNPHGMTSSLEITFAANDANPANRNPTDPS